MRTIAFAYTNASASIWTLHTGLRLRSRNVKIFRPPLAQQLLLVIRRVPTLNASIFFTGTSRAVLRWAYRLIGLEIVFGLVY